jgi:hypothetical protein
MQTSLYDISKTSILIEPFYDFNTNKTVENSVHDKIRNSFETNQWLSSNPKDSSVLNSLCNPSQINSKIVDFELPRGASLMSKIHLHITVPQIIKSDGTFANICNKGGLAFVDSIQLIYRQGQIILEELDLNLIDIIQELGVQNDKETTFFIGQIDTSINLIQDSTSSTQYYIKIPTWFETKKFPLFLYKTENLIIRLRMKPMSQVVVFDGSIQPTWDTTTLNVKLYCQMIQTNLNVSYLQKNYMTTLYDYQKISQSVLPNEPIVNINISSFTNSVCLYVIAITNNSLQNNDYFFYGNRSGTDPMIKSPIINSIQIKINNTIFLEETPEFVLRARDPIGTTRYIYKIPINLFPDKILDIPDNGVFDFSTSQSTLKCSVSLDSDDTCNIIVYNQRLNALTKNFSLDDSENNVFSLLLSK